MLSVVSLNVVAPKDNYVRYECSFRRVNTHWETGKILDILAEPASTNVPVYLIGTKVWTYIKNEA
jgi:hypothetical protein